MNESPVKQKDRLDLSSIIKAVDRFEDQVEDRAYEELVPLHVKLALEDKVFGWSHLSSSIVGHVLITIGAYYISYFSLASLDLWDLQHYYGTDALSACSIRTLLSLALAVATFRFVRRRRHIWLRAPYGSSYNESDDQQRRKEVAETDYSTLLGHLRRRREVYLSQRVQQELSEAEVVFDSWKQKKNEIQSIPNHPSFQTFPTNRTTSIENDQVLFSPIKNMPYSHGGFFGAAPFMLANPDWITILRRLLPDVYVEISRRVLNAPARSLMHWAENNPVVAAYGTANELAKTGNVVNLEWDVFLDPRLVRRVEVVLEQQQDFVAKHGTESACWSSAQKALFKFLEAELERRSSPLVDKMLIAHGNLTQLMLEQTGMAKDYNYSRVKRTRRTLGGGMYARQWVAVYAEALELGMQMATLSDAAVQLSSARMVATSFQRSDSCPSLVEESDASDSSLEFNPEDAKQTGISLGENKTDLSSLSSSTRPEKSIEESVSMLRQVTNQDQPIGLVLDLKSRHVSKRIWSIVVNKLTTAGVHVEGVASFAVDEIRGIKSLCDKPLTEFVFCHSAGDMQQACHDGRLAHGDTVLFNGGSLLWETPELTSSYFEKILLGDFDSVTAMNQYGLLPCCKTQGNSSSIKAYKDKLNLKIGIYVQEFGIDEAALNILVKLVNENPDVFEYGLSWGGINGVTVRGIQPGRFTSTDGFHTQRYAGCSWNSTLSAERVASLQKRVL